MADLDYKPEGIDRSAAAKPTTVVNLRLTGNFDVYCGRRSSCPRGFRGEGADGAFGNPFIVQKYGTRDALALFRTYFEERCEDDFEFRRRVLSLRGRRLGCFCVRADGSGDCHAKIIAEWVEAHAQ